MDTARAAPSASLHRDGIVEAIAFTAERLLLSPEWREAAQEVLGRLGQAAGVSRAYIADWSQLTMDIDPVVIPVDASKIERIVENLLANTARHTPSSAHVWVSVRRHEGGALIKVEDSGVGVPVELRESLFEPFHQGPDAPQHSPGVGVGLTLVRRFAELHGGRAWIQERDGGGASFQVVLPGAPPIKATA